MAGLFTLLQEEDPGHERAEGEKAEDGDGAELG